MPAVLKRFEQIVLGTLVVLMTLVVLLSTIELGYLILKDIFTPPVVLLEIDELLDIFGFFLLVLIGVELLETIRSYFSEHVVHVEVVVEVALIAIARKVIILDVKTVDRMVPFGVAAMILALAVAFFVIKRFYGPKVR
jgi:uncharacterized membrane protein (DUF373 family)